MGLVGENVGLIVAGLAGFVDVKRVVFGGSTLCHNAALIDVLRGLCTALGLDPVFPFNAEYTGALGALEHARR